MDAFSANSCSIDDKDAFANVKQKSFKRPSTSLEYLIEAKKPFATTPSVIRRISVTNSQPFNNCVSEQKHTDIQHIPQKSPKTWNDTLPAFLQNPSGVSSITETKQYVHLIPPKDKYCQTAFVHRSTNESARPVKRIHAILPAPKYPYFKLVSAYEKHVSEPDKSMPLKIGSVFSLAHNAKQATTTSEQGLYKCSTTLKSSIKREPSCCSANVKTEPVTLDHSATDSTPTISNNQTPVPVMCVPNLNTIMKFRTEHPDCDYDPKKSSSASVTAAFKRVIETIGKVPEAVLSDKEECPAMFIQPDVPSVQQMPSFSTKLNRVANDRYMSETMQQAIRQKWKQTLGIETSTPEIENSKKSSVTLPLWKNESNSPLSLPSVKIESNKKGTLSFERKYSHSSSAFPAVRKELYSSLTLSSVRKEPHSALALCTERKESNDVVTNTPNRGDPPVTYALHSEEKELNSSFASSSDINESRHLWTVHTTKTGNFYTKTGASKSLEPTSETLPTKRQSLFAINTVPSETRTLMSLPSMRTVSSNDSNASLLAQSDIPGATVDSRNSYRNPVLLSKLKKIVSSNISRSKDELIATDPKDTKHRSVSTKDNASVSALLKNLKSEHFADVNTGPDYNKSSGNTNYCEFPKHSETLARSALGQYNKIVQRSKIETLLKTCKACSVVLEKLPLKNAYFRTKCWKKFLKYKRPKKSRQTRISNKTITEVNTIMPQALPIDDGGDKLVSTNKDSKCFDMSYSFKRDLQAHTGIIQSVSNEINLPTQTSCNELVPNVNRSNCLDDALHLQDTHLHKLVSRGNPGEAMKLPNSSTSQPHGSFVNCLPQTQVLPISTNAPVKPTSKDTVAMKCVLFNFQGKHYICMVPEHDLLKAEDGSTIIKNVGKLFLLKTVNNPTS